MVSILVLENEKYTRRFLEKIVKEIPLVDNVYTCASSNEAFKIMREHHPDIALLDIELDVSDEINGIETAKILGNIKSETHFVFITGYSKYALASFSVHPYDYILKPIDISKMIETINSLVGKVKGKKYKFNGRFIVKNKDEIRFIDYKDIIFVEKEGKEVVINTRHDSIRSNQSMADLEKLLCKSGFIRCHQSFIANLREIDSIRMIGDRTYTISFKDFDKSAEMSRYKFEENKNHFTSL